jgi:hypothetical protein
MTSFKSGSGDLDFDGKDETDNDDTADETTTEQTVGEEKPEPVSQEQDTSGSSNNSSTERKTTGQSISDGSGEGSAPSHPPANVYPYFVRRNNVGDERDNRMEIHVRDKVTSQESNFRTELAEYLDVDEIPKTDAREFALLTAFQHPESVAELMRDEGFGALEP